MKECFLVDKGLEDARKGKKMNIQECMFTQCPKNISGAYAAETLQWSIKQEMNA